MRFLLLILCLASIKLVGQVGIGTNDPDINSALTIKGDTDDSGDPTEDYIMSLNNIKVSQYDPADRYYLLGLNGEGGSASFPLTIFQTERNHLAQPPASCVSCVRIPHFGWQNANASNRVAPSYYGVNTQGYTGWIWPYSGNTANSAPSFGPSYVYGGEFAYPKNATSYRIRGNTGQTVWNDFFTDGFTIKNTTDLFITFNLANNMYNATAGAATVNNDAPCTKYAAVLADTEGNLYDKNGKVITSTTTAPHTGIVAQFSRIASMSSGSGFATGVVRNVPPGTYRVLLLYGNGCNGTGAYTQYYLGNQLINGGTADEHAYSYNISVYYDDFNN